MSIKVFPPPWRVIAFAVIYFVVIFFGRLPDRLILFPTRMPVNPSEAVRRTVQFENGHVEIWTAQSRLAQSNGTADVYVLRFYGNADRAERWPADEAEMWPNHAIEVWGVNYPGFGGSTGPARLSKIGPAALAAFDELRRYAGERPIVPFGTSIGATAALHVAAHRPVPGLILQNPPPLREMILRRFGWWNLWLLAGPVALQIPKNLDSVVNARAIQVPAIFLRSEKDEIVPPTYQRLVVNAYGGAKRLISLRGASHNDPIDGTALAELHDALDWLFTKPGSSGAP